MVYSSPGLPRTAVEVVSWSSCLPEGPWNIWCKKSIVGVYTPQKVFIDSAHHATFIYSYNTRGATCDCVPSSKTGHAEEKLYVRLYAGLHIRWTSDKSCQGMNMLYRRITAINIYSFKHTLVFSYFTIFTTTRLLYTSNNFIITIKVAFLVTEYGFVVDILFTSYQHIGLFQFD